VYNFTIRTAIVNYITPEYTEKNLSFDIYELLESTQVFLKLREIYLQFKLKKVMFAATPRVVGGTDPSPAWIYLDTAANNIIHYSSLQELQGSRALPVKRFSVTSYTKSGRQNDFNYWYDTQQLPNIDLAIRLHCETPPDEHRHWQFQIGFQVDFRGLVIQTINTKVRQIPDTPPNKEIGSENKVEKTEKKEDKKEEKKKEKVKKFLEDVVEDMDWNQEVSDDENFQQG
jgi:predicted RNA-binding protein Jag